MQSVQPPGEVISLESACARLAAGEFAFVDAGCSAGGSMAYCERVFGRGRGIGFDRSRAKLELARAAGFVACEADLETTRLPARSVHFVSLLDFLEHLPSLDLTRTILAGLCEVARDFLFVRHPSFEDVDYLASLGLKLDWTDWHGHRNPLRLADFEALARDLGLPPPTVIAQKPIADASHPSVVPLDAAMDTVGYDPTRHGPKPDVRFDRLVHAQFDVFLRVNPELSKDAWFRITERVSNPRGGTTRI